MKSQCPYLYGTSKKFGSPMKTKRTMKLTMQSSMIWWINKPRTVEGLNDLKLKEFWHANEHATLKAHVTEEIQ